MATLLSDILAKPVNRSIDGVIKADDKTSLLIELDEYVTYKTSNCLFRAHQLLNKEREERPAVVHTGLAINA